jgi:SAM-dependent methyltransferase
VSQSDALAACPSAAPDGAPAFRYDHQELGPAHRATLNLIPAGSSVLEVGCSTGYMTRALSETRGCRVTAVDVSPVAMAAATVYAACGFVHDMGAEPLPADCVGFDAVVLADVLEHLRDPEGVLRDLRRRLNPTGALVVSLPNVAFWQVRLGLLRGRWDYTDVGILDRTHLHFYTRASLAELAWTCGLRVASIEAIPGPAPLDRLFRGPLWRVKERLNNAVCRRLPRLFGYQYVARLVPVT